MWPPQAGALGPYAATATAGQYARPAKQQLNPIFGGGFDFSSLPPNMQGFAPGMPNMQGIPSGEMRTALGGQGNGMADPNAFRAAIQAWRGQRPGMFDPRQFMGADGFNRDGLMGAFGDWRQQMTDWRGQRPTYGSF